LIPKHRLGRIGEEVTIITLGGCAIGKVDQETADKHIKMAFDYGVNMIDVAPTYGDAEERLAPWMPAYRNKVVLAEKTTKRTKKSAWDELNESLKKLNVKKLDLYQMHALGDNDDIERAFGPGGAIEAFLEAKETGLVDFLGITGHADMRILMKALERFDFDNVLLPITLSSAVDFQPVNDYRPVLEHAEEYDMGVTAIKAICKGRWSGEKKYKTWYEPLDSPEEVLKGVRFTLSQPGVTTAPLACDHRLWEMTLDAGVKFTPMTPDEQDEAVEWANENDFSPLFPE